MVNLFIAIFPQPAGRRYHSFAEALPSGKWLGAGRNRAGSWSPCQAMRLSRPIATSSPKVTSANWCSIGFGPMIVLSPAIIAAKFYLVEDSIRLHRSDGSLFRIVTSLQPGETEDAAQQRLLSFASNIVPLINQYVPR